MKNLATSCNQIAVYDILDIQSYLTYKLATKYVAVNKDYIQIHEKVKE